MYIFLTFFDKSVIIIGRNISYKNITYYFYQGVEKWLLKKVWVRV